MEYFDKNGKKICVGMQLKMADGTFEKVYRTTCDGKEDLGINASNDAYMKAHGIDESEREFYSLSSFNLKEVEIV